MTTPLHSFTQALWHGDELILTSKDVPTAADVGKSLSFLSTIEVDYRKTLPLGLPPLSTSSAEWALLSFYRAAQFLVFRDLPVELLRTELTLECPDPRSASSCYSVDLTFRFLPELIRMTRAVSSVDPLMEFLMKWANDWPLSAVGVPLSKTLELHEILDNAALRTLLVDRILAVNDVSWLAHPPIREAIRSTLGGFRELSPLFYDLIAEKNAIESINAVSINVQEVNLQGIND